MAFQYTGPSVGATMVVGAFNEQLAAAKDAIEEYKGKAEKLTKDLPPDNSYATAPFAEYIAELAEHEGELRGDYPSDRQLWEGVGDLKARVDQEVELLKTGFGDLLEPLTEAFTAVDDSFMGALQWVSKMQTEGGSGLKPEIEDQIWQRERSRLLKDASRASSEAMRTWAARGYPLPPGALVGQLASIDQDARGQIAESSRTRAIEAAKMELDNLKWSLDKLMELRDKYAAMAVADLSRGFTEDIAALDQAKTLIEKDTVAADATNRVHKEMLETIKFFEDFKIRRLDLGLEQQLKSGIRATEFLSSERLKALLAEAQVLGTRAAAALNALHAQAGFSASEQV